MAQLEIRHGSQPKVLIFSLFVKEDICCGYSLEVPC